MLKSSEFVARLKWEAEKEMLLKVYILLLFSLFTIQVTIQVGLS